MYRVFETVSLNLIRQLFMCLRKLCQISKFHLVIYRFQFYIKEPPKTLKIMKKERSDLEVPLQDVNQGDAPQKVVMKVKGQQFRDKRKSWLAGCCPALTTEYRISSCNAYLVPSP